MNTKGAILYKKKVKNWTRKKPDRFKTAKEQRYWQKKNVNKDRVVLSEEPENEKLK